jgi:hypothetical protein
MNTCKDSTYIKTLRMGAVDDPTRYRYKVVGRNEKGEEIVVHRCNSVAEAQRVWQETLSSHSVSIGFKSRTYNAIWWTLNNPAPLSIYTRKRTQ